MESISDLDEKLHIMDVPGFAGIRIHAGNTAKQTSGCVLVGGAISENMVINSRNALERLEGRIFPLLNDHQLYSLRSHNGKKNRD